MSRLIVCTWLALPFVSCGTPTPQAGERILDRSQSSSDLETSAQTTRAAEEERVGGVEAAPPARAAAEAVAASTGEVAADPSSPNSSAEVSTDLSKERALLDEANSAVKASDYATARARASAAIDELLQRPEAERGAAWLEMLNRGGRAAWSVQDSRAQPSARGPSCTRCARARRPRITPTCRRSV